MNQNRPRLGSQQPRLPRETPRARRPRGRPVRVSRGRDQIAVWCVFGGILLVGLIATGIALNKRRAREARILAAREQLEDRTKTARESVLDRPQTSPELQRRRARLESARADPGGGDADDERPDAAGSKLASGETTSAGAVNPLSSDYAREFWQENRGGKSRRRSRAGSDSADPRGIGANEALEIGDEPFDLDTAIARYTAGDDLLAGAADAERSADHGSGPNRLFTISLGGRIGTEALGSEDAQTWARLGYFMQHEASQPHALVFPSGNVPVIGRRKKDGTTEFVKGKVPVQGDPSNPTYRLRMEADSSASGGIGFYGGSMGGKYVCKIFCAVEKLEGDDYVVIDQFTVGETHVQARSKVGEAPPSKQQLLRRIYDVTLDKLAKRLRSVRPFKA